MILIIIQDGILVLLYRCTHYPVRGGFSSDGASCGEFFVNAYNTAGNANLGLVLLYHCTHYTMRGGRSNDGTRCGVFYVATGYDISITSWNVGAALSRVHIILFVVVFLTVMHFGAYSLLVLTILLLLLAGVMELL